MNVLNRFGKKVEGLMNALSLTTPGRFVEISITVTPANICDGTSAVPGLHLRLR
jgi:hypothetical protein